MNKTTKRSDSGFTIIEVVLVLAIAALIMLMVFIALPALQRGQRDTQRQDDVSRLQSAVSNYSAANRGNIPSDQGAWEDFIDSHMLRAGDTFADPSGSDYTILDSTGAGEQDFDYALGTEDNVDDLYNNPDLNSIIYVFEGGSCNFETQRVEGVSDGSRSLAILKALESGSYECREV